MNINLAPLKPGRRSELETLDSPARKGALQSAQIKPWQCQVALAAMQFAFCLGTVYLKSSLQVMYSEDRAHFHPIIYAFLREVVAGPIMCAIAYLQTRSFPQRQDLVKVAGLGVCLWLNQLLFILGIDLSGVVVASCMQPIIPVFTALIAVLLKLEAGSLQKFAGIGIAVVGSVCMVMGGVSSAGHARQQSQAMLLGNLCLLVNTLASALYFLGAKKLVQTYSAMCVAAWAYVTAATLMGLTAALFVEPQEWHLPAGLLGPLVYWIFICSVLGYYVVTFSTQHLPASQVASFQCLQPFVGTLLAFVILGEQPSVWDLGAIGVIVGLITVAFDRKDQGALRDRMRRAMSVEKFFGKGKHEAASRERDKRSADALLRESQRSANV